MLQPPSLGQVRVEVEGAVGTVTLDRPERRNALGPAMLRDLLDALTWCRDRPELTVVVLTGAGERAFCAGADLASFNSADAGTPGPESGRGFIELLRLMRRLDKPLVGRINGHALAGGFGLACSCDLLVAAETATFGTPEVNVGVWPMMIQAVLRRQLPRKVLLEMVMLGDRWTAGQMRDWGLVNRVVPAAELDAATAELAGRLAAKPPAVMRLGRESFYEQDEMGFEAALDYLQGRLALVTATEDAREGIRAFFEKRSPRWTGR